MTGSSVMHSFVILQLCLHGQSANVIMKLNIKCLRVNFVFGVALLSTLSLTSFSSDQWKHFFWGQQEIGFATSGFFCELHPRDVHDGQSVPPPILAMSAREIAHAEPGSPMFVVNFAWPGSISLVRILPVSVSSELCYMSQICPLTCPWHWQILEYFWCASHYWLCSCIRNYSWKAEKISWLDSQFSWQHLAFHFN